MSRTAHPGRSCSGRVPGAARPQTARKARGYRRFSRGPRRGRAIPPDPNRAGARAPTRTGTVSTLAGHESYRRETRFAHARTSVVTAGVLTAAAPTTGRRGALARVVSGGYPGERVVQKAQRAVRSLDRREPLGTKSYRSTVHPTRSTIGIFVECVGDRRIRRRSLATHRIKRGGGMRLVPADTEILVGMLRSRPRVAGPRERRRRNELKVLNAVADHGTMTANLLGAACWPSHEYTSGVQMAQRTIKRLVVDQ